jgi:hypothetical protein
VVRDADAKDVFEIAKELDLDVSERDIESEDGVYRTSDMKRVGLRANFTTRFQDGMDLVASSGYFSSRINLPQNDNNAFSFILNGLLGGTAAPGPNPCPMSEGGVPSSGWDRRLANRSPGRSTQLRWTRAGTGTFASTQSLRCPNVRPMRQFPPSFASPAPIVTPS